MLQSLPSRGVWIEISMTKQSSAARWSLPSRGVWIEILYLFLKAVADKVAPLAGSVD